MIPQKQKYVDRKDIDQELSYIKQMKNDIEKKHYTISEKLQREIEWSADIQSMRDNFLINSKTWEIV